MTEIMWIIAQKTASPAASGAGFFVRLVPFFLIFVLFYFLVLRPQRKRDDSHKRLLNSLKKGDRVLTSSGIFGNIYSLTPQRVVLEIAPKVKIEIQRAAIVGKAEGESALSTVSAEKEEESSPSKSKTKSARKKKK